MLKTGNINWYLVPGRSWSLDYCLIPIFDNSCILKLVLVSVLDHNRIFKMLLVHILNNSCILKMVLVPLLNIFLILKLVLVPVPIFLRSKTGTGTSYRYRLHFKGVIHFEMRMRLLQYGLYLNKIVDSGIFIWADQLVVGSYEIVKPIISFYCYFFIFIALF